MQKVQKGVTSALLWIFLIGTSLFVLYPLIYVVSGIFSGTEYRITEYHSLWRWSDLVNFKDLFQNTDFPLWFRNSLIIAVGTTVGTVFICALSAYVFSRFHFTFKRGMLMSLLILQIFPSFVGMVAIYVILMRVHGLNTLWGLILIYMAGNIPYNTWMVKSYMDMLPKSLDEAARIDGAGHFTIFWKVILPTARPIMVFLTITSFTAPWMDFIFPKMVLRSSKMQTVALGLFSFVTDKKIYLPLSQQDHFLWRCHLFCFSLSRRKC